MTARAHDVNNRLVIESTGWIQPCNQPIGNWYFGPDGENHYFTYNENDNNRVVDYIIVTLDGALRGSIGIGGNA